MLKTEHVVVTSFYRLGSACLPFDEFKCHPQLTQIEKWKQYSCKIWGSKQSVSYGKYGLDGLGHVKKIWNLWGKRDLENCVPLEKFWLRPWNIINRNYNKGESNLNRTPVVTGGERFTALKFWCFSSLIISVEYKNGNRYYYLPWVWDIFSLRRKCFELEVGDLKQHNEICDIGLKFGEMNLVFIYTYQQPRSQGLSSSRPLSLQETGRGETLGTRLPYHL